MTESAIVNTNGVLDDATDQQLRQQSKQVQRDGIQGVLLGQIISGQDPQALEAKRGGTIHGTRTHSKGIHVGSGFQ